MRRKHVRVACTDQVGSAPRARHREQRGVVVGEGVGLARHLLQARHHLLVPPPLHGGNRVKHDLGALRVVGDVGWLGALLVVVVVGRGRGRTAAAAAGAPVHVRPAAEARGLRPHVGVGGPLLRDGPGPVARELLLGVEELVPVALHLGRVLLEESAAHALARGLLVIEPLGLGLDGRSELDAAGGVDLRRRRGGGLRRLTPAFRRRGIGRGGCGRGAGSHAARGRRNAGVGLVDVAETLLVSTYTVVRCGRVRG